MKKIIKIILIIIFFICFLGCFLCPLSAFSEDINVYTAITQYRDLMQAEQNAVLSQFFTYNYVGLSNTFSDSSIRDYRINFVVTSISRSSDSNYSYITYFAGNGSYYYSSDDSYFAPHGFTGNMRIRFNNGVAESLNFLGNSYYFDLDKQQSFPKRYVTYYDLTDSYYTNSHDGTSLQNIGLFNLPTSSNGIVSTPSVGDTFGNIVDKSIDIVAPAPVVTTVSPFQPPATVPPVFSSVETVTALPVVTDDGNNYYIDYSPYIDGKFYSPPVTDDISLSPALSASGAIISESFGWLTDSGVFSVLLVLMLVSFAIYNLI